MTFSEVQFATVVKDGGPAMAGDQLVAYKGQPEAGDAVVAIHRTSGPFSGIYTGTVQGKMGFTDLDGDGLTFFAPEDISWLGRAVSVYRDLVQP